MIDVCLLGTGGMMPLPNRYLTALMVRYNGKQILVDCGEGTQVAMKKRGWSAKPIDMILLTHFHADHVSGLPGLLLTMGNADRREPLLIAGPRGVERVVNSLRVICQELPFEIRFRELAAPEEELALPEEPDLHIRAFKVRHSVPCYGYSFCLDRAGRFHPDKALALDIPKPFWGRLQKGETIETEDRVLTPDMVLGPPRRGILLTYCTDTRPCDSIVKAARNADLFICEGMYGEDDKLDKAREKRHMTFREAAELGREAQPERMWLTHYSPSMVRAEEFQPLVRSICSVCETCRDGRTLTLRFPEDGD